MNVELISIGDELLIGQTINTNAAWLGQTLTLFGARITKSITISDQEQEIINALKNVNEATNCTIITGGLGPTNDDITKHTLANYFGQPLVMHEETLRHIEHFFAKRNRPMLVSNQQQAMLPAGCTVLPNKNGTAAGLWFNKGEQIVISLPGVPYEMKCIVEEELLPLLAKQFNVSTHYHKTAHTQGIGESFLAEKIAMWEQALQAEGLHLAYLPSPGFVKLRINSFQGDQDKTKIDRYFEELETLIPEAIYGYESDTLVSVIAKKLVANTLSIGTVESCTAGLLAHELASISGSSSYFQGSLLTYSNELKVKLGRVDSALIEQFGAVSSEVACEMASQGRKILAVDFCISTTGIAGPTGGTTDKPVGLVWIAIATKEKIIVKSFHFGDNRARNQQMTVSAALNFLRYEVLQIRPSDNKKV